MSNLSRKKAYVVQSKDEELLLKCTSGGFFTTVARAFINDGGYVCGAVYNDNFEVNHVITNKIKEVEKFAGSKYVQSKLNNTFKIIKKLLDCDHKVLFCGTPCQVQGLRSYLTMKNTDISKLFLIDLVCHGVPSPKLWNLYLDYAVKKRGALNYINFRSKYLGYHTSVMEEINKKNKRFVGSARTHLMTKIFFSNIADRQSCYNCHFKTIDRNCDLTLFDSWHAKTLVPEIIDNDKGYSNIIIQSDKGNKFLLEYAHLFKIYSCNCETAVKLDGVMVTNSVKLHPQRNEFYEYLYLNGIEKTINKFLPIKKSDYVFEKIKIVLKRTPILTKLVRLMVKK